MPSPRPCSGSRPEKESRKEATQGRERAASKRPGILDMKDHRRKEKGNRRPPAFSQCHETDAALTGVGWPKSVLLSEPSAGYGVIFRVELNAQKWATEHLRGKQGGAGPGEGIEHHAARRRERFDHG